MKTRLVIAIEPGSVKVACIRRTRADTIAGANGRAHQVAAWDKNDTLWMEGPPNLTNSPVRSATHRRARSRRRQ
jgi:hypothetical protein